MVPFLALSDDELLVAVVLVMVLALALSLAAGATSSLFLVALSAAVVIADPNASSFPSFSAVGALALSGSDKGISTTVGYMGSPSLWLGGWPTIVDTSSVAVATGTDTVVAVVMVEAGVVVAISAVFKGTMAVKSVNGRISFESPTTVITGEEKVSTPAADDFLRVLRVVVAVDGSYASQTSEVTVDGRSKGDAAVIVIGP